MGCRKLSYYQGEGSESKPSIFLRVSQKKNTAHRKKRGSYYPFGLVQNQYNAKEDAPNKYLYNAGSEIESKAKLYNTAFRQYDPSIGRFMGVDALAGLMQSINSYQYAFNNPVAFNDPTGLIPPHVMDDPEMGAPRNGGGDPMSGIRGMFGVNHWANHLAGVGLTSAQEKAGEAGEAKALAWMKKMTGSNKIESGVTYSWEMETIEHNYWMPDGEGGRSLYMGPVSKEYSLVPQYEELSKYLPVALMWALDGDFVIGLGVEGSIGFGVILRGPDAGKWFGTLDGTNFGPTAVGADASVSLQGQYVFYSGDINNFSAASLEGFRTELSIAFDAGVDIGFSGFRSHDKFGGTITGGGGSLGVGFPVFGWVINGNVNIGTTTIYGK
jgi:RHS repeat-associated protein